MCKENYCIMMTTSCTDSCLRNVINLGNSIIGVSILAMPYCFQKCGILLSILLIVLSGIMVRIACHLLLKGATMARRRNFEFLAFHAFGPSGKLAVEIGVIAYLIGVCIAFFVVIGDLGPPVAVEYFMVENTQKTRASVMVLLGLFVALPLALLRKVDSLTSLSALSIAFYICLILKIFTEASSRLALKEWWHEVNWWRPDGILPCLPIFSMALSCQTSLFEFFDTLNEPSLKRMNSVVCGAVNLCSSVYVLVGFFGYIACHDKIITGNILVNFTPSLATEFIKIGFIITVAISFPLCLFPCRTSLHSLLFKQGFGYHDSAANFIPDHRFRWLTISLVSITVGIAIMLPSIEFVLGIIGSTVGTIICLIFPAIIFIHDTNKNTTEKRMAQAMLFIGIFILVACTYSTLNEEHQQKPNMEKIIIKDAEAVINTVNLPQAFSALVAVSVTPKSLTQDKLQQQKAQDVPNQQKKSIAESVNIPPAQNAEMIEKRQEPPEPVEPEVKIVRNEQGNDLDPQALQKEDKELKNYATVPNMADASLKEKQEQLIRKLEEQQKEQQIILEEQKKVLEELKLHKESHSVVTKESLQNINNLVSVQKVEVENVQVKPDIKESRIKLEKVENTNIRKTQNNDILAKNREKVVEISKPLLEVKEDNFKDIKITSPKPIPVYVPKNLKIDVQKNQDILGNSIQKIDNSIKTSSVSATNMKINSRSISNQETLQNIKNRPPLKHEKVHIVPTESAIKNSELKISKDRNNLEQNSLPLNNEVPKIEKGTELTADKVHAKDTVKESIVVPPKHSPQLSALQDNSNRTNVRNQSNTNVVVNGKKHEM